MSTITIDDAVIHDLVAEVSPDFDERPDDHFVRAAAALLRPHIEAIATTYHRACAVSPLVAEETRLFMLRLLEAEA